jgi:hypothetical protein
MTLDHSLTASYATILKLGALAVHSVWPTWTNDFKTLVQHLHRRNILKKAANVWATHVPPTPWKS